MAASIDVTGLTSFSLNVKRAMSGDLQKALVKNVQDNERPIVADMHAHAHTKIQRRGLGSVHTRHTSTGLDISGGGGGDLGGILFDGAEYGGRKGRKVVYATRSPLGRAYVIKRRTTMQFLQWLGQEGYWFWPAIRDAMTRMTKQQDEIVKKALG